jgi:hypothetical protein
VWTPRTLHELLDWFPDDEACLSYPERVRWGDGFACPGCGTVGGSWWVVRRGLQRVLGFGSYQTAWAWLHKLRRAMVLPGRELLSGAVQVDEMLVGPA